MYDLLYTIKLTKQYNCIIILCRLKVYNYNRNDTLPYSRTFGSGNHGVTHPESSPESIETKVFMPKLTQLIVMTSSEEHRPLRAYCNKQITGAVSCTFNGVAAS